ncbi:MAG TPA: hypothetical protein VLA98_06485 [Solirubrobacteraceae bacterium]|nr:hypothetical protein [Solirubrobacteraceae bacterium]HSD81127.1 hypothetical protein [Solirubrobacteraceae bacterium]
MSRWLVTVSGALTGEVERRVAATGSAIELRWARSSVTVYTSGSDPDAVPLKPRKPRERGFNVGVDAPDAQRARAKVAGALPGEGYEVLHVGPRADD